VVFFPAAALFAFFLICLCVVKEFAKGVDVLCEDVGSLLLHIGLHVFALSEGDAFHSFHGCICRGTAVRLDPWVGIMVVDELPYYFVYHRTDGIIDLALHFFCQLDWHWAMVRRGG